MRKSHEQRDFATFYRWLTGHTPTDGEVFYPR